MKPSFALSLSFDGIRLLKRAAGGWRIVGDVALDAADMAAELAELLDQAKALAPEGVRSKVLLPNEQIKYLTINTPDMSEEDRRAAAIAALDGATPYPVDDLAFDISLDGDKTHIAAVAQETLAEAEAFAVEHAFNPVSFAAMPGDQAYLGEPFFGLTSAASDILAPWEKVDADGIAVVIIGTVADAPVPDPAPEAPTTAVAQDEVSDVPDAIVPTDAPTEDATPTAEPEPVGPASTAADPVTESPTAQRDTLEPDHSEEPPLAPEPTVTLAGDAEQVPTDAAVKAVEDDAAEALTDEPDPAAAPEEPVPTPIPSSVAAATLVPEEATEEPQRAAPAIGFASRRAPERTNSPQLGGVNRLEQTPIAPPAEDIPAPQGAAVTAGDIAIAPDSSSLVAEDPVVEEPKSGFLSRRRAKAPVMAGGSPSASSDPTIASEEDRMTIFGARNTQVGGKPRFLGLILTAALLVFLAGVAAWASVFLDDGLNLSKLFGTRAPETVQSKPPEALPAPPSAQAPAEPPAPEEVVTASLSPALTEEDTAVLDALREPVEPEPPEQLSEEALAARYAATGIWPRAPEVPPEPAGLINIEDLYLTSIDPVSTTTDAVALPKVEVFETDVVLAAVSSPAAPGTQFALDADGLVIPTVQGALSPDGFTVYRGRPPVVPPATPTRFETAPQDTAIRSALAAFRPQPRPSNLIENTERAQLDGLTRSELAAYRPALRPPSLQEQAAAAAAPPPEAAPVDTDDAVTAALAEPDPFETATRFAATASIRPDTRPRNFKRIVQRAQKRATEQQEVRVASAAAVAPRAVQPKIPSSASVAKQATVRNALNLRRINLIGVYGKPSNRRALVRLSNGRYKKVVVGDRIDGGRVSAIGDSELRYKKGGRDLVLKMPR